jgi:IS30 family transposase
VDTIVSRESKSVLVTAVERKTLTTIIERVPSKEADVVARALIRRLSPYKNWLHTITGDNGKEFADHVKIASKLSAQFYFARPYHSWERGTNENTNGLIRQYFPKKTDLAILSNKEIRLVEQRLNNRPRKSLGYFSTAEYFQQQTGLPLPMGMGRCLDVNKLYNCRNFAIAA